MELAAYLGTVVTIVALAIGAMHVIVRQLGNRFDDMNDRFDDMNSRADGRFGSTDRPRRRML